MSDVGLCVIVISYGYGHQLYLTCYSVSYLEIYNETIHDLLTTLPDVKQPPGKGTGQTTSGLPITEVIVLGVLVLRPITVVIVLVLRPITVVIVLVLRPITVVIVLVLKPITVVIVLDSSLSNIFCTFQDDRGRVSVKGLTFRPVRNEEEALNYLFEVSSPIQHVIMYTCTMCKCYWCCIDCCVVCLSGRNESLHC